ncbi:threonine synthase [Anaerotardibacter muris]|uniref:threonine synthase n=1 Tax=Anaerotardibacter muris TaxID=2941505 RepID=UPI0020406D3D|nr:threonine synthase [Anaerotardibacter muris]
MTNNLYIDTRGNVKDPISFTEAIVKGLAQGGGLFVPESLPTFTLDQIVELAKLPYAQRAAKVYQAFDTDLDDQTIERLMAATYGDAFDTEEICPITSLDDDTHVLELWHGPTSAFKDMALQCLPYFFSESAAQLREKGVIDNTFLILVATSGDTGKAALEGFKDKEGIQIAVMYPDGGVSDIQYKQMATQGGSNVDVWAVTGNFDDCQTGAKNVFDDEAFNQRLMDEHKVALSSANSINWGRLLPQVVYYISTYGTLVEQGKIKAGDPIDVCVPTGNFGNILAAWYAKQLGTPIDKLICASNENRILTDFITTGTYDIRDREFILTPSPSMDILVSSNVERQLFELSGRNSDAIAQWMKDLKENKCFTIDDVTREKLQAEFKAGSVDSETCLETIKETLEAHDYLVDPHTAVAVKVAQQQRGENPVVIASTAHWAKFGDNVYKALHGLKSTDELPAEVAALTGCQLNELIAKETGHANIPQGLAELDQKPIRFTTVIEGTTDAIEAAVEGFTN